MTLKVVQFIAILLTASALVPAGAHLFALPNKIGLVQEQYFIVQSIYRGWSGDEQLDDRARRLGAATRWQWEHSHAANALIALAALRSVTLSVLMRRRAK